MGLDALVHCRCWQDGLATPPPCAPELVGFDGEGRLSLLLEWEGNEELHNAFYAWLADGCPHEGMEQAGEHVSNWGGYRLFQQALGRAGWEHFPTMRAELPRTNGGRMPADAAPRMLAELDYFDEHADVGDDVVLRDEATGRVVLEYIAGYHGITMFGPGYRAGVDPDGFFVLDGDATVTLFRAVRFRQRVLDGGRVEFTDGTRVAVVPMDPVGGDPEGRDRFPPPEWLRAENCPRAAADYAYVVGPLRRLCAAAIATGNPVLWT